MIQIKKTILTLVALLAVTTGAWAEGTYTVTFAANGNTKTVENVTLPKTFQCNYDKANGELDLILKELYSWTGNANQTFCDGETTPTSSDENKVVAGSDNGDHYITINNVFEGTVTITGYYVVNSVVIETPYSLEISIAAAAPAVDIAWDKATKTGTFTMPGGNVTLEPEYYPQATVADGGVTAADADARATTDDPLVKVDATKLTGAKKLMYFVSNSGTTAPAYDAEGWTDQLPTAEGITQQGIVYVWYYPVGTDEGVDGATATYSDGDICLQSITARIAPEPTYAVTFAEGTDPNEWKAEPAADVTKGQTVTVTYTGSKKVIGVKAEKKARPEFVPSATIQDLSSFVEVKNNKDGTITLHMPTLNPSTYNVTNSSLSNGEHTLHFGYEMGSGTNMSSIGVNIIAKSWFDHTPFSELDKTIDITSGMPRVAIMITGHVKSSTCPAPGKEHYWGLYRYTNPVKVTYNLGGGSVSGSTADKVEYLFSGDALATTFAAPTREGYTFDGWYTSAEGGTKLTASYATSATTIYAHWNAIAE